jgi:uncharacterized protein
MEIQSNFKLLRIFIGEADKTGHQSLYEAIVLAARQKHLAGATVLRGIMGFGANSVIHSTKWFELSTDLPIVIEIVDDEEKIRNFISEVERLIEHSNSGALITLEKAEVIRYLPMKK